MCGIYVCVYVCVLVYMHVVCMCVCMFMYVYVYSEKYFLMLSLLTIVTTGNLSKEYE